MSISVSPNYSAFLAVKLQSLRWDRPAPAKINITAPMFYSPLLSTTNSHYNYNFFPMRAACAPQLIEYYLLIVI